MAKYKGAVVIDTKMDNSKITSDFKSLDKKTKILINRYNQSVDSIKSQELAIEKVKNKLDELVSGNKTPSSIKSMESELKSTEKEIQNLEVQYNDVINKINQKKVDLEWAQGSGNVQEISSIKFEQGNLDTQSLELADKLENARDKAEQLKNSLQQLKMNSGNSVEVQQLNSQLELMNSKLSETKSKTNQLKDEIKDTFNQKSILKFGTGFNELGKKIDKFKSRMTTLIGSIAIFSLLRNSLTSLRNGFISLLKQNDTFSNNLNQIKANLMAAFAPIYNACLPAINSLMNAISKLTGTIAKFVSSLFGVSLKDANKQAKKLSGSLKKVSTNGDKANDSLASFDDLNVLPDNSATGGSAGGVGDSGIDYSGEIQYSQKLLDFLNMIKDFIIENKELVMGLGAAIVMAFATTKIIDFLSSLDSLKDKFSDVNSMLMGLGIGLILAGIVISIKGIIDFIKDPSWENFSTILIGLSIALAGVAVAMLAFNAANPVAWIMLAVAAIVALVGIIIRYWDEIKNLLGTIWSWIYDNVISPIYQKFSWLFDGIKAVFTPLINIFESIFSTIWENIKITISNIKQIFSALFNAIKTIISPLVNFFSDIWSKIKNGVKSFATKVADAISGPIKAVINSLLSTVENVLNTPIKAINGLISVINAVPGVSLSKLKTFSLPRLASGAVIPPRQEFAAILGDQKHGTNIEAPLDTIKQANREVLEEFFSRLPGLMSSTSTGSQDININFVGSLSQLARLLKPEIEKEEKRVGTSMITGVM